MTDLSGEYTIEADSKAVLVFSFLGFNKFETTVGSKKTINVTLKEDSQLLDEVVVVGYGTMKKKDLTGAIGMVDAEAVAKELPTTMQDLLRVGVPGLSMGIAKDAKGNAGDILIRGKNSFRDNNTPLVK